jgi:hypothetical protein
MRIFRRVDPRREAERALGVTLSFVSADKAETERTLAILRAAA